MSPTIRRRPARPDVALDLRRVLRSSLAVLRRRGPFLVGAAVLVFLPVSLADAAVDWLDVIRRRSGDDITLVALIGASLLGLVLTNVGAVFYSGVLGESVAAERAKGRPAGLLTTLRSLPYLRLLAVEALYIGAVVIGLVLFIVPGVVAFAWFALAGPLTTIDGLRPTEAMRRSFELVRGNEGRVLAVVALAFLAEALTGGLIGVVLPETGLLGWLGALVRNVAVAPLLGVATVVMALELGRAGGLGPQIAARRSRS